MQSNYCLGPSNSKKKERMPCIAVVGGTGQQGGAVARALLANHWTVRALTRRPSSAAARELARLGCELVEGDLGEPNALLAFFRGADAAFVVTQFWQYKGEAPFTGEVAGLLELSDGKNAVDAARCAGVPRLVVSALDNAQLISGCRLSVPHFDYKAMLQSYTERVCAGTRTKPAFVHVGFYAENLLGRFRPRKCGDHYELAWNSGSAKLPVVSVGDVGRAVLDLLAVDWQVTVGVVAELLSGAEICEVLSEVSGAAVRFVELSDEAAEAQLGAELAHMFAFYRDYASSRTQFDPSLYQLTPLREALRGLTLEPGAH